MNFYYSECFFPHTTFRSPVRYWFSFYLNLKIPFRKKGKYEGHILHWCPPTLSNRSTFCLFPDNIFSLPDNMSTSPTWVDDHWWDQSSGNLDKKPLSYYNWTNMKRGNVIVIGQFKHKEYVAWWRSSGSPLSIAGIGKSGQIVRGDIWTRKSIPQPADPTTTQTLNPNLWIQQQQW